MSSVYDDPALLKRIADDCDREERRQFRRFALRSLAAMVLLFAAAYWGPSVVMADSPAASIQSAPLDAATAAGLLPFWGDQGLFFDGLSGDFQCQWDDGCTAIMPGEDGPQPPGGGREGAKYTKVHKFKKGDIISTSSGWIVNPAYGWKEVD